MGELQRDARGVGVRWCGDGRRRGAALLVLAGVLLACGGRPPTATTSQQPDGAGQDAAIADEAAAAPDGPSATSDGLAPASDGPSARPEMDEHQAAGAVTEADCQALLVHVVAVANAAHARTVAPEYAPTDAQLAEIRARMAPELMPVCLSFDRATIACQMRARDRDALLACTP